MGKVVIMTLVSPDELVFRPTRKRSGGTAVNVTNSRRRSAHAPLGFAPSERRSPAGRTASSPRLGLAELNSVQFWDSEEKLRETGICSNLAGLEVAEP